MSRCILDDETRGTEVAIGWDPPMETFFARVADHEGEMFWLGGGDQVYDSPEVLVEMIQPYAGRHDRKQLILELLRDKAAGDGERVYDLCLDRPGRDDLTPEHRARPLAGPAAASADEWGALGQGEPAPRWLRPVDPRLASIAEIRVDPALGADAATVAALEQCVGYLDCEIFVFMTSAYPAALAAELIGDDPQNPHILVRPANAEETMSLHEKDIATTPRQADWSIDWREKNSTGIVTDQAVIVWTGEVLLNREPGGMCGPFYAMQAAAEAWAFHAALGLPAADVCSAQAASYTCAAPFAARLLQEGASEFKRLRNFWESPIRSGRVIPVWLPKGER